MRFLLIQPFSLCLYTFSLPAVVHPVEGDKGCTRVQWLARKFELMASAKYRTISERLLLASIESSRRSSSKHSDHNENLVDSTELLLVDNIDQEHEDDNEFLEYEILYETSDIYEGDTRQRDSVMSEISSINDGSIILIEKITANVTLVFDENENENIHTAEDGSNTFLR